MSLTLGVTAKLGPLFLVTALRHFLDKFGVTEPTGSKAKEEFSYDEAFSFVKSFLEATSRHTVEEMQEFCNTRIPASPHVVSIRLLVPLSSCNQAATYLIKVLGGEEHARRIVGGTRWWQVRGLKGIDANWIAMKKDWKIAKKQRQMSAQWKKENGAQDDVENRQESPESDDQQYSSELDPLRCMYYIHGGGYFFGSVDQYRYSLQRYARKMNGRIFAINYRLAPQYPFPCAIHDALAGYLYLLKPPPGASHEAVNPSQIIIGGDSAGGGTVLALLQVIRDAGLPLPAGAVLISPWGDLTHSFPSVFENTVTDIVPSNGLSLFRPSTLWPPPSEEMETEVKGRLTTRIRDIVRVDNIKSVLTPSRATIDLLPSPLGRSTATSGGESPTSPSDAPRTILGDTVIEPPSQGEETKHAMEPSLSGLHPRVVYPPAEDPKAQPHTELPQMRGKAIVLDVDGKPVEIKSQIQLYAMNHQLTHPLVSPVLSYLGGLPPLFVIASDKEVLRDEIVYMAHKAAHPEEYPVHEPSKELYPPLRGIEERYGPTNVHLQIYDETCHVLPMLSFTTPAKFCYRAIVAFCLHVAPGSLDRHLSIRVPPPSSFDSQSSASSSSPNNPRSTSASTSLSDDSADRRSPSTTPTSRSLFHRVSMKSRSSLRWPVVASPTSEKSEEWEEVGPRFAPRRSKSGPGYAGHANVYKTDDPNASPFKDHMIRERVSMKGELRELEPSSQLAGCIHPFEKIGKVNETGAKRYLSGQALWDKRYAKDVQRVAKNRQKHLKLAKEETQKSLEKLKARLDEFRLHEDAGNGGAVAECSPSSSDSVDKWDINSPLWNWGWALEGENPPPSSIVARRDTEEARRLSKIADKRLDEQEVRASGNNVWAIAVDTLTRGSYKQWKARPASTAENDLAGGSTPSTTDGGDAHGGGSSSRRAAKDRKSLFGLFQGGVNDPFPEETL